MPNIITIRKGGYRDLIGKSLFDCHDREMSRERIKVAYEKMKSDGKEVFIGVNAAINAIICRGFGMKRGI